MYKLVCYTVSLHFTSLCEIHYNIHEHWQLNNELGALYYYYDYSISISLSL